MSLPGGPQTSPRDVADQTQAREGPSGEHRARHKTLGRTALLAASSDHSVRLRASETVARLQSRPRSPLGRVAAARRSSAGVGPRCWGGRRVGTVGGGEGGGPESLVDFWEVRSIGRREA